MSKYIDANLIPYLEIIGRIAFAIVSGFIIGFERRSRKKPVGIVTNTLVCVGATMLSIYQQVIYGGLQIYGFSAGNIMLGEADNHGRIVAQIVSGIGFLGAGAIMRDRNSDVISGITTAATLWIMACLGIVIGSGYWFLSISSVISIVFVLYILRIFVNRFIEHEILVTIYITCDNNINIQEIIKSYNIKINKHTIIKTTNQNNNLIKTVKIKLQTINLTNIERTLKDISSKHNIYKCSIVHGVFHKSETL